MAWLPIANTVPQYIDSNGDPYSGAVLKAYQDGTSTNTSLATDNTGGTTATSMALNSNGYPEVSGTIVIPHIDQAYKLSLYPTQTAADADSGAIWTIDNLTAPIISGTNTDINVKVSSNDTTAGYLNGKLVAGSGITLTEGSDGGNETFTVSRDLTASVLIAESADHANTPAAGFGEVWVKSDAPNILMFTDDAGTDFDLITVPTDPNPNPLTLGTEQATTSGTTIDFTSIPSWAQKITISFFGVSTSGTDQWRIRLGDAGGVESSGYLGASSELPDGSALTTLYTSGFGINVRLATAVVHGAVTITLEDATNFTWIASGIVSRSDADASYTVSGSKSTSAALDRIQITTSGGTDTFDAGAINILYE